MKDSSMPGHPFWSGLFQEHTKLRIILSSAAEKAWPKAFCHTFCGDLREQRCVVFSEVHLRRDDLNGQQYF